MDEKEKTLEKVEENVDANKIDNTILETKIKKPKKSKKKLIISIIIIIILISLFLFWWFNRKFTITFEYNNGMENKIVKVKYLSKIKEEDVEKNLTLDGYNFIEYFETYYLNGQEIEKIQKDVEAQKTICKDKFKLDESKTKCIAVDEFDFKNTKITSNKKIEALWSTITFSIYPAEKTIYVDEDFAIAVTLSGTNDTAITWSSEDSEIATVDDRGRVVGRKVGQTNIVVESNHIKRKCLVTVISKEEPKKEEPKKEEPKKEEPKVEVDEGTISLRTNNQCIIGYDTVTVNATVNNAKDDTINWNSLKCFNINKDANNQVTISRIGRGTMCRGEEELNPIITATLNNGNSDSLTFNYESNLSFTVYNNGNVLEPNENGIYEGNNIKIVTNQPAIITATNMDGSLNYAQETSDRYVILKSTCTAIVTIKTTCGQTKTIKVYAIIN